MNGEDYYKSNLTGPMVIVVGAEGKGLGRLVKEKCDIIVSLPMQGYNVPQSSTGVDIGLSDLSCFVKQKMDSGDACNIYSICSVYD